MKLHKIYSKTIAHLPESIREEVIKEAPHTRFIGFLPPELEFLGGTERHIVDLGFEDLGLPESERKAIFIAFTKNGVAIPGTNYKIRVANAGLSVVELIEPGEELVVLPDHWKDAVMVMDGFEIAYVGKLSRHNPNNPQTYS